MLDSDNEAGPSLESRLGVFLLKDPTLIERLPEDQGKRLDQLIEANSLEPLLYQQVEAQEAQNRVASRRISAWKLARLSAAARTAAYRNALDEIVELGTAANISIRLLLGTQVTFYLCEEPELRPVSHLKLQVPPEQVQEFSGLLKARGFGELDDLSTFSENAEHHLPPLERDGVAVTIYRRSCARLPDHDGEPFPMDHHVAQNNPEVLRGEPLLTLLVLDIFEQSFCRSLISLLDLHRVLSNLRVDWQMVERIVVRLGIERQFFCMLSILQELFNSPVDMNFLATLESSPKITPSFQTEALPLVRSLLLQYPVPFEQVRTAQGFFTGAEVAPQAQTARETQVLPRLVQRRMR